LESSRVGELQYLKGWSCFEALLSFMNESFYIGVHKETSFFMALGYGKDFRLGYWVRNKMLASPLAAGPSGDG